MSPSPRTRRGVLSLGGSALALLTGCLSASPATSDDVEPTENPTQTTATTTPTSAPADVTVSNVQLTPELVALDSPDSIGTFGERGEQFVLVTILVDSTPWPAVDEFSLSTDDESFTPLPTEEVPGYGRLWERGYAYGGHGNEESGGQSGYLVFEVPKPLEASNVVFRGPGGQFSLGQTARDTLARRPTEFAVTDVTAPETVESLTEMELSATIENVGTYDGTFVGAMNRVGPHVAYTPVTRVSLDLSAGESKTWTHSYRPQLTAGNAPMPMRFKLDWRDGRISTETMVEWPS
ncbi:hypothetical protein GJR96_15260 [Haloferax sp. MBLA0076]|uniref:Uncharacterized protein n=1 Tax=Haloferax litoreum TaxID=2666140 RepID=A0A6A8GKJ9_9EURY|nr:MULTISPECIES: hypothetical protein [Haloferax]KAB1194730.1 hypothetical protein Hfx1148_15190 [Haloferax sp. CBA1148]MRX23311.1 hypothetical protein [Haloferax litoreum]